MHPLLNLLLAAKSPVRALEARSQSEIRGAAVVMRAHKQYTLAVQCSAVYLVLRLSCVRLFDATKATRSGTAT